MLIVTVIVYILGTSVFNDIQVLGSMKSFKIDISGGTGMYGAATLFSTLEVAKKTSLKNILEVDNNTSLKAILDVVILQHSIQHFSRKSCDF